MHILFICTDNGLGHLNRSIMVAKSLSNINSDISFFAPRASTSKLNVHRQYNCYDLSITPNKYYHSYDSLELEVVQALEKIPHVNLIVFDNLPILKVSEQYTSILYANFYWHVVLHQFQNTRGSLQFNQCLSTVKYHAATSLFCMNHVDAYREVCKINPFDSTTTLSIKKRPASKHSILISIGTSNRYTIPLDQIELFCINHHESSIYLEPKLYAAFRGHQPSNSYIACYSPESYSAYDLAIVRPGLGTSIELVRHNISSISVYEPDNSEMRHNASVLSMLSPLNKNYQTFAIKLLNATIESDSHSQFSQLEVFNQLSDTLRSYRSFLEEIIHEG